jgi:hypothetical protein
LTVKIRQEEEDARAKGKERTSLAQSIKKKKESGRNSISFFLSLS